MRLFKFLVLILLTLFGIYTAIMYFFADESKTFTVEKEIDYPMEKVFPQFNNFQNFVRWNAYFSKEKNLNIDFFMPYEGQGSAIRFREIKGNKAGEMYIRYENKFKTLKYQLFEDEDNNPYVIDLKFKSISPTKTKITWYVHSPKLPLLQRSANFWTEEDFVEDLEKSMANLKNMLANKVDKDEQLQNIKYDSIMVDQFEGQLLLGVNVSTSNKKDALQKNIVMNYSKVFNFVTSDLGKEEDEVGLPVMINEPSNYKDKEVSYYMGVPLSKRIGVSDNNFSFRTINASKMYTIFYKGSFAGRQNAITKLLQKAKKDTMRHLDLMQTFIEPPEENSDVMMKIELPVFK